MDYRIFRIVGRQPRFRVETDESDFAVAGVLLQQADDQSWNPVSYVSRKLPSAERNYTAAERETLAVVYALRCWRIYLFRHFHLYTDNMGVVYLRTKPNLTKRQARWSSLQIMLSTTNQEESTWRTLCHLDQIWN